MLKISEILNQLNKSGTELNIVLTNGTITHERVYKYFKNHYSKFRAIHPDTVQEFVEIFQDFINDHSRELNRIYDVLNSEYNPLFNVEGTEERITGEKIDSTSVTPSASEGRSYERTNDDNTLVEIAKTNITASVSTTTPANTLSDSELTGYNNITHDIYKRSGNIGVTKSTELVESEVMLRVHNSFLEICISMFVRGEIIV